MRKLLSCSAFLPQSCSRTTPHISSGVLPMFQALHCDLIGSITTPSLPYKLLTPPAQKSKLTPPGYVPSRSDQFSNLGLQISRSQKCFTPFLYACISLTSAPPNRLTYLSVWMQS